MPCAIKIMSYAFRFMSYIFRYMSYAFRNMSCKFRFMLYIFKYMAWLFGVVERLDLFRFSVVHQNKYCLQQRLAKTTNAWSTFGKSCRIFQY